MEALRLYAVTDTTWVGERTLAEDVEAAIVGGVTAVQYRDKNLSDAKFLSDALIIKAVCSKHGVPFIINDRVHIAKACDADGVHIGQSDMSVTEAREMLGPGKIIGTTVKTVEAALKAQNDGADYVGSGAVFGSTTKLDTITLDHSVLKDICLAVAIPVVAIGGINEKNMMDLKGIPLSGVAVVSSLFGAEDIKQAATIMSSHVKRLKNIPTALTIAGSDSSGGAGIQADLKTMTVHGVFGMSVVTALTAQNTKGVEGILDVEASFVSRQMKAVFSDIKPDAVKIGMVPSEDTIIAITEGLLNYEPAHIIIDPVMVSTSGSSLLDEKAVDLLKSHLLPLATLVTPNVPEAEKLSGLSITSEEDMVNAAKKIGQAIKGAVLVKGGHFGADARDLLYEKGELHWYSSPRIDNPNTHGTGCTLSSAIASNLALGYSLHDSVSLAKAYISGAIKDGLDLGTGRGPLNHMYKLK